MRIFAAFIVMLVHINSIYAAKYGTNHYESFVQFGNSGVHIFFVLSGYVMYIIHKRDIGKGLKKAGLFAWKRFLRIYPTYWIITTLVVIAMYFAPGEVKAYKYNVFYIIQSYSLFEMGLMEGNPIIPAAWTLFHEIKFYAFFLLLITIPNKKVRMILILAAAALTASTLFGRYSGKWSFLNFYLTSFNWLFAFGILAGWITENFYPYLKSKFFIMISVITYIVISLAANFYLWEISNTSILSFGVAGFLLVTSFASYETYLKTTPARNPFKLNSKGLVLADATYCLYLLHYPVYTFVIILNNKMNLPEFPLAILMIITAFTVSLIYYRIIEFPIINALRKLIVDKNRVVAPKGREMVT